MSSEHHPADLLLRDAFPLVIHLAQHLSGESAIEEADHLIGRMAGRLMAAGLMERPRSRAKKEKANV